MSKSFKNMSGAKTSEDKTIVVFMGVDLSKGNDMSAYWKYDGVKFTEISKEEYEGFVS